MLGEDCPRLSLCSLPWFGLSASAYHLRSFLFSFSLSLSLSLYLSLSLSFSPPPFFRRDDNDEDDADDDSEGHNGEELNDFEADYAKHEAEMRQADVEAQIAAGRRARYQSEGAIDVPLTPQSELGYILSAPASAGQRMSVTEEEAEEEDESEAAQARAAPAAEEEDGMESEGAEADAEEEAEARGASPGSTPTDDGRASGRDDAERPAPLPNVQLTGVNPHTYETVL